MGCDLCVYVPDNGEHDCAMAYSSFNRVRDKIVFAYLELMGKGDEVKVNDGEAFTMMVGVTPESTFEKVSEALYKLNTEEADSLKVLWEHSDCDGTYWWEDCENIASAIRKVLPLLKQEEVDTGQIEALLETFSRAVEVEGFVEVL